MTENSSIEIFKGKLYRGRYGRLSISATILCFALYCTNYKLHINRKETRDGRKSAEQFWEIGVWTTSLLIKNWNSGQIPNFLENWLMTKSTMEDFFNAHKCFHSRFSEIPKLIWKEGLRFAKLQNAIEIGNSLLMEDW